MPQGSTGTSFQPTYSLTTNRYQSVSGCTPAYDANGFATNDCARQYTWDSAGNPRSIDTVNLTYDALGRMIEQGSGTYTQIVYGATGGKLALMNGQTLRKAFVPLPGGAAAVYISTGLSYYRHSDWLGSGRLATTTTRTMLWDVAYAPYGETYASSGTVDANFTGQNQDTVSNIYDFLFREYNAPHGRWPWPDPAGLEAVSLSDPQTWNRYAYVRDSPLDTVDPLGLLGRWDDVVGSGRRSILHPGYGWSSTIFYGSSNGDIFPDSEGFFPTDENIAAYYLETVTCCSGPFEIGGTGGWDTGRQPIVQDPCKRGTAQVTNAPNVPPASPAVQDALNCISSCTGEPLLVTSTSRVTSIHPANSPHGRGQAADLGYIPGITNLFMRCAGGCGVQFALDETLHPSANSTGPHFHLQLVPGLKGGHGDLPVGNDLECR